MKPMCKPAYQRGTDTVGARFNLDRVRRYEPATDTRYNTPTLPLYHAFASLKGIDT